MDIKKIVILSIIFVVSIYPLVFGVAVMKLIGFAGVVYSVFSLIQEFGEGKNES